MDKPLNKSNKINKTHFISTFYKFLPLLKFEESTEKASDYFKNLANKYDILGLMIVASEGFNATVSSTSEENLKNFKNELLQKFNLIQLNFKDSQSEVKPFKRFVVKIRPEIVTLGTPDLVPEFDQKNHHLTPEEWNQVIEKEKPVIIDTRNWYEYKIGTFEGALNPNTEKFSEFPDYMEKQNISKDEKILIFCTGGIRCEKGILELHQSGYENVYQLDGGILNYIEKKPFDKFKGECFVFDHRVAVDQELKPTKNYSLCPHCGQPGQTKIQCKRCDSEEVICELCSEIAWKKDTCSKNCAYHFELHPDRKGPKQPLSYKDKS